MPSLYGTGVFDVFGAPVDGQAGALAFFRDLGDAIEATQAMLGANPKGAFASVEARLNAMAATGFEALVIYWATGDPPTRIAVLGATTGADATRTVFWLGPSYAPYGGGYALERDVVLKVVTP